MKVYRLYCDTSLVGGYYDEEFSQAARELWRQAQMGLFRLLISTVAHEEIEFALEDVRTLFLKTFSGTALIDVDEEMSDLADAYLAQGAVTGRYRGDAIHVAVCTVAQLDFLVSWNFKHLVNVSREAAFNGVNLLRGYRPIRVVNPLELIYGHESKEV